MLKATTLIFILLLQAPPIFAMNFSGARINSEPTIEEGAILDCNTLNIEALQEHFPSAWKWAISKRLVKKSLSANQFEFSDQITTKDASGRAVLFVGCWIATKVVTAKVGGSDFATAEGKYHINDELRSSPLMFSVACKCEGNRNSKFIEDGYRIFENSKKVDCSGGVLGLPALEATTVLFPLVVQPNGDGVKYIKRQVN